jgi:hypothetical protein
MHAEFTVPHNQICMHWFQPVIHINSIIYSYSNASAFSVFSQPLTTYHSVSQNFIAYRPFLALKNNHRSSYPCNIGLYTIFVIVNTQLNLPVVIQYYLGHNYMFWPLMLAIIRLYRKLIDVLYTHLWGGSRGGGGGEASFVSEWKGAWPPLYTMIY